MQQTLFCTLQKIFGNVQNLTITNKHSNPLLAIRIKHKNNLFIHHCHVYKTLYLKHIVYRYYRISR